MKRGKLPWFLLVLLVVLAFPVRANFACGVLNGSGNLSASWFEIIAYYSDSPEKKTSCKVSPQEFKFCCDPLNIEGQNWAIGREITAEVRDEGYVAGPVELTISGEGYDVFPTMELERVITVRSPSEEIYVGTNSILVNLSVISEYNKLEYLINYSGRIVNEEWGYESNICDNCTHAEFELGNLPYGDYELIFIAENRFGEAISESRRFSLIEELTFSRKIECLRCSRDYVYSGEEVAVAFEVESSQPISGEISDYYPLDWTLELDDPLAEVSEFSETHRKISWRVNGERKIERKYSLVAPNVFFTKNYDFQTSFDNYLAKKSSFSVYWFYRFWPFPSKYLRDSSMNYYFEYAEISPENAFVMDLDDEHLSRAVIYPKKVKENIYVFVHKKSPVRKSGADLNFVIGSNLDEASLDKIEFQFRVEKPRIMRNVAEVDFFGYDIESESWVALEVNEFGEDDDYKYYEVSVGNFGAFAIDPKYEW